MTAQDLMESMLHHLRNQFYDDTKTFAQQRRLLMVAITTPAAWLRARGVSLPARRQHEILMNIVTTIKHHGATGQIRFFSGYFLHTVQAHLKHQGERYYIEGRAARNHCENALGAIRGATATAPGDDDSKKLAEIHRLMKSGTPRARRPQRAKKPSAKAQQTLF